MSILRIEVSGDCYIGFAKRGDPALGKHETMALPSNSVTFFKTGEEVSVTANPWRSFRGMKFVQFTEPTEGPVVD